MLFAPGCWYSFGFDKDSADEPSKKKTCIFEPDSQFRLYWDLLIVLFILYNVACTPLFMYVPPHRMHHPKPRRWDVCMYVRNQLNQPRRPLSRVLAAAFRGFPRRTGCSSVT